MNSADVAVFVSDVERGAFDAVHWPAAEFRGSD